MRRIIGAIVVLVLGLGALIFAASEFGGEVVTLHTRTADGDTRTHLWVVDDSGIAWLRAGSPRSGWLARLEQSPEVRVERGGRMLRFRALPLREPGARDRIHRLMRAKYGLADRLVSVLRDPDRSVPVRLDPLPAER